MRIQLLQTLPAAMVSLGALAGCGSADDTGLLEVSAAARETEQAPTKAPTAVAPVDAVIPEPDARLLVTVREVSVHVDGWHTVFLGAHQLDLLDTSRSPVPLGTAPVPEGELAQLRLVLADNVIYQKSSGPAAVRCPSCSQSGLKLQLTQDSRVVAGGRLSVTLQFASNRVLWANPQGYVLSPVVEAEVRSEP